MPGTPAPGPVAGTDDTDDYDDGTFDYDDDDGDDDYDDDGGDDDDDE